MSRFGTNIPRFVRTLLVGVGLLALAGLFITPLISKPAYAAPGINKMINFQGKVVNSDGTNVPNGTYSFVFKIWDAASVGTTLWTETQSSVTVTNGIFQVELGSVTALPGSVNFNTDNLYLSLNFNADGDMSPRIRFDAVPYAFNSDKLNGLSSTQFVRTDAASTVDVSSTTALVLQNTATNVLFVADTTNQKVGIGAAPTAGGSTLQVTGTITSTGTITVGTNTSLSTTTLTIGGTGVCTVSGCTPVTNSGSYIQNTTSQQASSNFNISGNGTIGGVATVGTSLTTPILQSAAGATLLVDSGTTGALNIGTGANAKTVTIGNATGATAVNIQSGTGGITLTPVGTSNSGVLVKPTNNSTSTFQVQSSTGYQLVNVDSTFPASNLITNPGFEVNTTGWSNKGTGALTRITSPASNLYYGVGAGSLAMTAANDGVAFAVSTTVGTTYSLSFYAKSSSGVTANLAAGYTNGSGDNNCTLNATTVSTAGFQRYSCSFSVATTNGTAVYIKQTAAQSMTIILDASMLVSGTSAVTPYGISNIALRGTIVNPMVFQSASDSTTALQIQNAAGTSNLLVADSLNTRIGIGATPASGLLTVGSNTTAASGGVYFGTDTNLYRSAASTLKTDSSFVAQTAVNSITAFQVQNASGTAIFNVDTSNSRVGTPSVSAASTASQPLTIKTGDASGTGVTSNSGDLTIDTGSSTNGTAGNISIGTGGYSHNLTLGNLSGTSTTAIQAAGNIGLTTSGALSAVIVKPTTNSPVAFMVENSSGVNVPIGADTVNNIFTSNAQYTTGGTISQSTTTVTGVGTAFVAGMVGGTLLYADGTTATVTAVASTTSLTVNVSKTVASTATYYIRWGGLTVTSTGVTSVQTTTNSTTAFQIQNAAGTSNLLMADTTNTRIGIGAIPANGTLTVGTNTTAATGGLYLGTDTNLYRSAASTLKTDGNLYSSVIGSNSGAAREIGFTDTATAGSYYRFALDGSNGFQSGNAQNAKLYSYWGLVLQGSRQTVGAPTFVAGAVSDPSVTVLSGGTAQSVLVVKGIVSQTATLLEVQDSTGAPALSVGATGATTFKNIANSIAALSVQNAAGTSIFNVDTTNSKVGTVNTTAASTNSQALNIKSGDASGATSNSGDVTLDSGTATGTAGNLNIGTGAYAHNTTIGNSTGSTGVTLQGGTGASAISVQSAASGTISIGTVGVANTVQIGNTSGAVSQTINLGTNAVASSNTAITLGSTIGTSPVTIQSGTSGITATSTSTSGSLFTVSGSTSVAALRVVNSGLGPHIQSGNGSGTNIQGANLLLAAGQGTGSATGGSLNLQVATTGTSGSSLNNLVTVFSILPGSGSGFYMPITDTANTFVVRNASNIDFFNIDTLNKKINIGVVDNVGALLVLDTDNDATLANGVSTNASAEIDGAMFYNSTNATFECGQAGVWVSCIGGLLSSNTAVSATLTNPTVDTNFSLTYTLPANYCTAGRVIRWTASGKYSAGATTTALNFKLKAGATVLAQPAGSTNVGATVTNLGWRVEGESICNAAPSATSAVETDGIAAIFNSTTGRVSSDLTNTAPTNLATNGNLTLQISAAFSASNASNNVQMRQFIIEGLGP